MHLIRRKATRAVVGGWECYDHRWKRVRGEGQRPVRDGLAVVYDPDDSVSRLHPQYEVLVEACSYYLEVGRSLVVRVGWAGWRLK